MSCSFFFYVPNPNSENKEFIYFDSQHDDITEMQGASMNDKYVFFWNLGIVWALDVETRIL